MMKLTTNRVRNYAMWLAVFALIPLLVEGLGTYDISILLPGNYEKIYTAVLTILVLAGIINNPNTENHWFKDED